MKCFSSERDWELARQSEAKCKKSLENQPYHQGYCRGFWDKYACWAHTPPNTTAEVKCPVEEVVFFNNIHGKAYRYCQPNGSWWKNHVGNIWANYSDCPPDGSQVEADENVSRIMISGYAVSICFLLLAVIIYLKLKSLRTERVAIHINFFLSFIIGNLFEIAQFWANAETVISANPLWCRIASVLHIYGTVTNFAWMFCEGLYLYLSLTFTFFHERSSIYMYMGIGWGIPVAPVIAYAILRSHCILQKNQLIGCWRVKVDQLFWVWGSFVALYQVANWLFMAHIVGIIVSKVRASHHSEISWQPIWKSAKALLILIPVLGIHYIITDVLSLSTNSSNVWSFIYAFGTSYQGTMVAVVLCFLNSETQHALYNHWRRVSVSRMASRRHNRTANGSLTDAKCLQTPRDLVGSSPAYDEIKPSGTEVETEVLLKHSAFNSAAVQPLLV